MHATDVNAKLQNLPLVRNQTLCEVLTGIASRGCSGRRRRVGRSRSRSSCRCGLGAVLDLRVILRSLLV